MNAAPRLIWDWGTAYDLFASLHVLHQPERFGLRGSWAAGVRSRLPAAERKFLEDIQEFFLIPYSWIYGLPAPKDAATALFTLSQTPAAERLPALTLRPDTAPEVIQTLQGVKARRNWIDRDVEVLRELYQTHNLPPRPKVLTNILEWWTRAEEFGECYLAALQAYHGSFFAEEERSIRPYLQEALTQAQALAAHMEIPVLLEELSQGVQFPNLAEAPELVLAPSYWISPLVGYGRVTSERRLVLFGARPAELSLVPGEMVPEALLLALKALADPTRLRVLRYLAVEPLTPSELSRRLRLRAPTVIHHLNALRLAGLVRLTLEAEGEKRYAIRLEAVDTSFAALKQFLESRGEE